MKKFLTAITAAFVTAMGISSVPALSAGTPMNFTGDERVDVYDLICARKSGLEAEKLNLMADFLLGVGDGYKDEEIGDIPNDFTIDESCILEPKGTIHTGDGTYYGGGYVGGCAMLDPVSTDYWIVAMNLADYNDAQLAGAYLEVTGELGTINMLVTDLLPEGKKGDLDLYVDAFPLIAPKEKGRVPVSWKIIPLDTAENAPVCYKWKEGTTEFWCGVQVRNHRYPITKLEYLNENGEFVEIKRRPYNYFESMEMGKGPFTFRITDIYGQVIIDENIPLSTDDSVIIEGHVQFPK
jgi:expansin (peptidoglycan-binding protein)